MARPAPEQPSQFTVFMQRTLRPVELEGQLQRVDEATNLNELGDADLLWMLALDLVRRGLGAETPAVIVAHLRSRRRFAKTEGRA